MTEYLRFLFNTLRLYQPVCQLLRETLIKTNNLLILDLCSGSGGAMEGIYENLKQTFHKDVKIILSDLFPNLLKYKDLYNRTDGGISYIALPVDASDVPSGIKGIRTVFSGFHHFEPNKAKDVIKNAVENRKGIGIFDGGNKSIWMVLVIIVFHPVMLFFCAPFIKPFRWSRIIFTYLIPVIPFCTVWDGIISIARLYKPEEMLQMAQEVDQYSDYQWTSGKLKNQYGMSIAYLIGTPLINNINN